MYSVGCDIKQELNLVKNKIYSEIIANKGIHIYQPEMFREFCISAGATNIFDAILDAITSARHSAERINLNKKRAVSVIYNLCYCLSQACNTLQTDHALYLRSCNINQEGIETQHIMGLSCARRTVNTIAKSLSENHCKSFKHFIQDAIENKWLLVLIIDDFTSIHTKRRPQADKASEAKSMCTIVVKAFKNIPAISVLQASIMHDVNGISINTCLQIITSASCMQNMSCSYASVMPNWLTEAFFNPELQRQRLNTHQYSENDNVQTMRKMDDLHLVDFVELQLKSKEDFNAAYDIALSAGLGDYAKKFIIFQPGDWPCQFFCRQIIYQCVKKFISYQEPRQANCENTQAASDHSAYSYPSFTGSDNEQSLPLNLSSQPSILSVIPMIGPLHISLNSREHIVTSFHPFFKTVYERIFTRSKLADKPKPWRISLLLEIVYGGWTLIRESVMKKFWRFKDPEYGTLFNLLDNYIPLVLSIYSISFKLNNFSEYFRAMIRMWIMFTCLKRRHYNKAPLVWLNMCSHWGQHSPQLYKLLRTYITIFDEYPVENTHSILRAQTKPSDSADELRNKAKQIFESKEQQATFRSAFTSPSQFSFSQNQLQFLKVKCAQVISSMLTRIATTPGQSSFSTNGKTSTQVKFPTICANNSIKSTALPLGYQGKVKPDATKQCDLPECTMSSQNDDWTVLTGCFHSFHNTCLNGLNSCPLCKDFLKEKVQELGQIAKQAILNPNSSTEVPAVSQDNGNEGSDSGLDSPTETTTAREMEQDEFENVIRQLHHEIASLNPTSQPLPTSSHNQTLTRASNTSETITKLPPHCRKCHHPVRGHKRSNSSQVKCDFCPNNVCTVNSGNSFSRCNCAWHRENHTENNTPRAPTYQITVTTNQHVDVTEWFLPPNISQSTIAGSLIGSNACTVISMLTACHFLEGKIFIPQTLQDLTQVIPLYSQLILKGNHIYSLFHVPVQQPNLEVKEVLQYNNEEFQKIELIADLGFFNVEDLESYLASYHYQHPTFAAVLIVPPDKTMVLCFRNSSICLFESHRHGHRGGIIASSSSGNAHNFVQYVERMVVRDWETQLQGSNIAVLGLK